MTTTPPILDAVPNLRQREKADGSWRVWWEPTAKMLAAGQKVVDLSHLRPGDAMRRARDLNAKAAKQAKAIPPAQRGTMAALIADYRASLAFSQKPASTRRAYGSDLKAIEDKWGPHRVALFDKPMVALWYESLHKAKGVTRARAILRMLSILMGHAELRGMRPENSNPCTKIRTVTPMERDRAASWDEFDAMVSAARLMKDRMIRVALHLAVMAGQRQYDIRAARPGDFYPIRDAAFTRPVWVWQLVQSKRKRAIEVPIHAEAVPAIRAQLMRAADGPGTLIWNETTGQPFSDKAFWNRWDAVRAQAALAVPSCATLQWRDLRRTFANLSRAGGSSDADTADALGNSAAKNPKLRRTYMAPQLQTTLRAVQAVQRPERKGKTG